MVDERGVQPEYRDLCLQCRRPASVCWCDRIVPVQSRTRACFLQHPREGKVAIGTARMAHLSLPNSELHVGVDFGEHARVRELAAQEGTALLFPGDGAVDPGALAQPPRTLIVVDGTWAQARKVVRRNPFLHALPRIGLKPPQPSNYRIRKEPSEECVSTIEAVVHVLGALERDPDRFRPLLGVFDRMVDVQLDYAERRPGPARIRRKPPQRRPRLDGAVVELRARPRDVVAVYAESNAHAMDSGVPGESELIQLLAVRPFTGERFEALIAPRRPLAPAAPLHLELPAERILSGESVNDALGRFRAFVQTDDLYCGWGRYAMDLLRAESGPERAFSDLRLAAARHLRRRPGGVEQAMRLLGRAELPAPLGEGRAGRRLAALAALLELLSAAEPEVMT